MAISDERISQGLLLYALILFGLYFFGGLLEIVGSLGLIVIPIFIPDLVRGFIVVIVSIVFLTAIREILRDVNEGYPFLLIGAMLGLLLFILGSIVLSSHALGWMLQLEDWVDWTIASDLGPPILLFPTTLPLFFVHHKMSKKPKRHLRRRPHGRHGHLKRKYHRKHKEVARHRTP